MRAHVLPPFLTAALSFSTVVVLFLLAIASPGLAVCPYPRPKPKAEFFHSDLVLTGTVVSQRKVWRKGPDEEFSEIYYHVRVGRVFLGQPDNILQLYSSVDSVGMYLDTGKEYLLFAKKWLGRKTLRIDSCGNSDSIDKGAEAIRQLEEIPNSGDYGDIEAELRGYDPDKADPDLRVIVRGNEREFVAKVDNHGEFHLKVPPGKYSLHVQSAKFRAKPYDFTFDYPEEFSVHRGGLAQMALDLSPKKH